MQSSGEAREMTDDSLSTSIFKLASGAGSATMGWVLPFRYALAVGALIIIAFYLTTIALSNNQEANTIFTDIVTFFIDVLVTLALFYGSVYSYFHEKRCLLSLADFSNSQARLRRWGCHLGLYRNRPPRKSFSLYSGLFLYSILPAISARHLLPAQHKIHLEREGSR